MTNDFGYTEEVGSSYLRFNRIVIDVPLNTIPTITGVKERVYNLETQTVVGDGVIQFSFDPEYEFESLDLITNTPTGKKMTMAELYEAISGCVQAQAAKAVVV